jgi:hypothetical protein
LVKKNFLPAIYLNMDSLERTFSGVDKLLLVSARAFTDAAA